MGTHPIFESDFDCLTDKIDLGRLKEQHPAVHVMTRRTFCVESTGDVHTICKRKSLQLEDNSCGHEKQRDVLHQEPVHLSILRMSTDDFTTDSVKVNWPRRSRNKCDLNFLQIQNQLEPLAW